MSVETFMLLDIFCGWIWFYELTFETERLTLNLKIAGKVDSLEGNEMKLWSITWKVAWGNVFCRNKQ